MYPMRFRDLLGTVCKEECPSKIKDSFIELFLMEFIEVTGIAFFFSPLQNKFQIWLGRTENNFSSLIYSMCGVCVFPLSHTNNRIIRLILVLSAVCCG